MPLIVFNLCTVNVRRKEVISSGKDILPCRSFLLALFCKIQHAESIGIAFLIVVLK